MADLEELSKKADDIQKKISDCRAKIENLKSQKADLESQLTKNLGKDWEKTLDEKVKELDSVDVNSIGKK